MIDSLRISVTQKCNLSCEYCHKEGQTPSSSELTIDDYKKLAKVSKEAGIKKIKITGGEPLIRTDIQEIIKCFNDFDDLSLVTNGVLLKYQARALKDAGLKRINIGCDSINKTNKKNTSNIISGIKAAKLAGIRTIKLNMVVLKGINENEIFPMIEFAKDQGVILQLIELINTDSTYYKKHYYSLETIEKELENKSFIVMNKGMHNRKQYNLGNVLIEVVRPFHNKFCQNCTRIRITSEGMIKRCLLRNDNLINFKDSKNLLNILMGETK